VPVLDSHKQPEYRESGERQTAEDSNEGSTAQSYTPYNGASVTDENSASNAAVVPAHESANVSGAQAVVSEEPEVYTDNKPSDDKSASNANEAQTESPAVGTNDYLELLNKVAKGEISPVELAQILQQGSVGAKTEQKEELSEHIQQSTIMDQEPVKSAGTIQTTVPYPQTPVESKSKSNNDASGSKGLPYPVTPPRTSVEQKETSAPDHISIPDALKPGSA
jgi:hypothetical protein